MKDGKKVKDTHLKDLKRSLEEAGLFVEALNEKGANIKPLSGKLSVKKTAGDTLLMFDKQELSLNQFGLKPFLEREENEYVIKNIFVIISK